jgi:Protein of unknown function (DUF2815)
MAKQEVTIVKKVKNGVLYSDNTIRIERVRLSYPHVGHAHAMRDPKTQEMGKAIFSITCLLNKVEHAEVVRELITPNNKRLMEENKCEKVKADAKFIRDGDGELVDSDVAVGHYTVSCRETRRPIVMDRKGELITPDQAEEMFYGGCWGHVIIRPWYQDDPAYGKRLNCGFASVRFWKDDEQFGEGRITADDVKSRFADIDDDEGSDAGGFATTADDDDDL